MPVMIQEPTWTEATTQRLLYLLAIYPLFVC